MALSLQAVWTQLWQLSIAALGLAVLHLALQKDRGKIPVHSAQSNASDGQPGKRR